MATPPHESNKQTTMVPPAPAGLTNDVMAVANRPLNPRWLPRTMPEWRSQHLPFGGGHRHAAPHCRVRRRFAEVAPHHKMSWPKGDGFHGHATLGGPPFIHRRRISDQCHGISAHRLDDIVATAFRLREARMKSVRICKQAADFAMSATYPM